MYLFTNRWIFKVMARKELERQVQEVRMSAIDSPATSWASEADKDHNASHKPLAGAQATHLWRLSHALRVMQRFQCVDMMLLRAGSNAMMDSDVALAYMGLRPQSPHQQTDSSDPVWLNGAPPVPESALSAPLPATPRCGSYQD